MAGFTFEREGHISEPDKLQLMTFSGRSGLGFEWKCFSAQALGSAEAAAASIGRTVSCGGITESRKGAVFFFLIGCRNNIQLQGDWRMVQLLLLQTLQKLNYSGVLFPTFNQFFCALCVVF